MGLWAPVVLQGPREMAHLGPAEPAVHVHADVVVLQAPPAMQSLSLAQPWLPQGRTVWGAGPMPLMQNCKHSQGCHMMHRLVLGEESSQPASAVGR